jgi:hypothetical protein
MALLSREQVKAVVTASLKVIADLPDDVESSTFANFNDQQKQIFLKTLKNKLNGLPYIKDDGTTTDAAYYDVDLTPGSIASWATVKDCIDWIVANQKVVYK